MMGRGGLPPWLWLDDPRFRRSRASLIAGLVVFLAILSLTGWVMDLPLILRPLPNSPLTQPLAAVSFLLAGLALYLHAARQFRAAALPLLALVLIAGSALLQYITGLSFGIDTLLFREAVLAQVGNPFPGRIYVLTSVDFLIFCLCLALPRRTPSQYRRVTLVATLGLELAFANFSGYLLGAQGFSEIVGFSTMAVWGAIGLTLLFGGVIQAQRGKTWLRLLYSHSAGGRAGRSLLPLILGWPLAVGLFLNLVMPSVGYLHQSIALAIVFVMVVLAAMVLRFARRLDHSVAQERAADAALRESEERYRIVVESAAEGIISIDRNSNIVFANPAAARIFGYSLAEMRAGKLTMLMSAAAKSAYEASFADYLATGRKHCPWTGLEVRGRHHRGHEIPIEISYDEFCKNGHLLFTGVVRDISERKQAEAALRALNERLEERVGERTAELSRANEALIRSNLELQRFVYIASHDLQTPLRSISGFVQLLQEKYQGQLDTQADEWARLVVDNTKRMQTLIQELLAYSRVDSQAVPFRLIDFQELCKETVDFLAAPIRETAAEVSYEDLPRVMGDRMQLCQVLQNLIDNAIKYHGDAPPRIHISAKLQGAEWVFAVRDNGIGIPARHHEAIFELFRRLHTLQAYPGTGIGLAICGRIIHRHGGRIWVESEPGKGSVFYFTLPSVRQEDSG